MSLWVRGLAVGLHTHMVSSVALLGLGAQQCLQHKQESK